MPGIESWPESWSQVAAEFQKEDVSIVAFDYPGFYLPVDTSLPVISATFFSYISGHGSSTYPEYYFPMTNLHGFSIRCLLNELAWDEFHLVGFSHGAYTAAIVQSVYDNNIL